MPAVPLPADPVPADLVPADLVPADLVPSDLVPADLVRADPLPADPLPAEALPVPAPTLNAAPAETLPAEPITTEPITTEPITTEPITTEPIVSRPDAPRSNLTEPEPATSEPTTSDLVSPATTGRTPRPLAFLRRHRGRLTAAAAMLATSGLVGWVAGDAWENGQDRSAPDPGPVASAVALDVRPSGGTRVRTAADVVVRITNLSTGTLTLAGAEASFDAGAITGMTPSQVEIPSGRSAVTTVDAAVACGSPQPLRLPAIQVRIDHRLRSVPVDGSAAVLGEVCNQLSDDVHLLTLESVSREDGRLLVVVHSPTGRTTEILGISARGVPLAGRGFPTTVVDAMGHTFWLDPPPACPAEWVKAGMPRTLDLRLDTGGESRVSLDLGFSLTRWLRDGPCRGAAR
jgi:hypothetical protein